MSQLVVLENNKPTVSTFNLYQKMGYKEHRKLKEVINTNIAAFKDFGLLPLQKLKPPKGSGGGRPEESYILNEDHFILLVLLAKNSPESVSLKIRVSSEFKRMKAELTKIATQQTNQQWIEQRKDGKVSRVLETDVIKTFIDYAKEQGGSPKGCDNYYSNFSKMENKALFFIEQEYKNLRDVLDTTELSIIQNADHIVAKALADGMDDKLHYKDIYKLTKERVELFAKLRGKSTLSIVKEVNLKGLK